jgi:hypothetical protein
MDSGGGIESLSPLLLPDRHCEQTGRATRWLLAMTLRERRWIQSSKSQTVIASEAKQSISPQERVASRSPSSGAYSRDPSARNDSLLVGISPAARIAENRDGQARCALPNHVLV